MRPTEVVVGAAVIRTKIRIYGVLKMHKTQTGLETLWIWETRSVHLTSPPTKLVRLR